MSQRSMQRNKMAELNSHVYVKAPDSIDRNLLESVFESFGKHGVSAEKIEEDLISAARSLNKSQGEKIAEVLIASVKESYGIIEHDLYAGLDEVEGFQRFHFVHGSTGHELIPAIVLFFGSLLTNADVRAYLEGDDDPWEMFYLYEDNKVVEKDYEPIHSERDDKELPEVYLWWHRDLSEISEGFINKWKAVADDEWEGW